MSGTSGDLVRAQALAREAVALDSNGQYTLAAVKYREAALLMAGTPSLKTKRDTYERRSRLLTSMFVKRESLPVVAAQGIAVISQAIALDDADHPENRPIALQLYLNGIDLLIQGLQSASLPANCVCRQTLAQRIDIYMKRAEIVRSLIDQSGQQRAAPESPSAPPAVGTDIGSMHMCVVCLDRDIDTVMLDCGHSALCSRCAADIMKLDSLCVICRQGIKEIKRIYIS
ncbi:RING-type domain-containing protein [Plasmodiophora brassicae]